MYLTPPPPTEKKKKNLRNTPFYTIKVKINFKVINESYIKELIFHST